MAKISALKTDIKKVKEGVWVDFAAGIKLLIASVHNQKYRDAVEAVLKPHLHRIRNGLMSAVERLDILKPVIAKYILLDWKNVEDDNGKPVDYSPEKALEYFNDPQLVEFFQFVMESAGESETFRVQTLEDAKENLFNT